MLSDINFARIRISGPSPAGTFTVDFYKHTGERLRFVVPPNADNDVLSYFQERMPYGLAVPGLDDAARVADAKSSIPKPGQGGRGDRRFGDR
jgi:hypothetical protein